ncbi:MAG: hypothetical protein ACRCXK_12085, partial [Wohlfahrtiimonas sp.]
MNNRKYKIVVGSRQFFEHELQKNSVDDAVTLTFIELIKLRDENTGFEKPTVLAVSNKDYYCLREQAIERLGAILDESTDDNAIIYVHNPPMSFYTYLNNMNFEYAYTEIKEEYKFINDVDNFILNI